MKALCFTLKGKTAFFKKPEVNSYYYFTYGNIHKVALLGIFGAILGYGGYTQQYRNQEKKRELQKGYPEFYEKLCKLNVSICPNAEKGFIAKKIQTFNNSVGYASKEPGGNLIVKEQWLENPSWDIVVLLDCEEAEQLAESITLHKCVYSPYLGKNDHFADIINVQVVEAMEMETGSGILSCLFQKENAGILESKGMKGNNPMSFKYQESLPVSLDVWTNNYQLQQFVYTDAKVSWEHQKVYVIEEKYKMFF